MVYGPELDPAKSLVRVYAHFTCQPISSSTQHCLEDVQVSVPPLDASQCSVKVYSTSMVRKVPAATVTVSSAVAEPLLRLMYLDVLPP